MYLVCVQTYVRLVAARTGDATSSASTIYSAMIIPKKGLQILRCKCNYCLFQPIMTHPVPVLEAWRACPRCVRLFPWPELELRQCFVGGSFVCGSQKAPKDGGTEGIFLGQEDFWKPHVF